MLGTTLDPPQYPRHEPEEPSQRGHLQDEHTLLSNMAPLTGNWRRSVGGAAVAAIAAHVLVGLIPNNLFSLNLTQTAVALLALSAVAFLVLAHHRSQGQFLSGGQEDATLIAAFGLFWLAILVTYRVFQERNGGMYEAPPMMPPQAHAPEVHAEANHAHFRTVAAPVAHAAQAAAAAAAGRHAQGYAQPPPPPPPPQPVHGRAPYAAPPPPPQYAYGGQAYGYGYNRRYAQGYDGGRGYAPAGYEYW